MNPTPAQPMPSAESAFSCFPPVHRAVARRRLPIDNSIFQCVAIGDALEKCPVGVLHVKISATCLGCSAYRVMTWADETFRVGFTAAQASLRPVAGLPARAREGELWTRRCTRNQHRVTRHSEIDHGVRSPWSIGSRSRWPRSRSGSR